MPLEAFATSILSGVRGGGGGGVRGGDDAASFATSSSGGTKRPRLVKVQRTSSIVQRRDVSHQTWASLLGLLKFREYFVTVDHFSIWRRHLSYAKEDGGQLRTLMTQKFSTNMVFMSLLLGAELNVLFNSSHITTQMREAMREAKHSSVEFWIGLGIITSVVLTFFTLLSTFTAWGMVSAVSDQNAHCVMRSSIGLYVSFLPSRLILAAIYSFLVWMVMFLFILLPKFWSLLLLACVLILFLHVVTVFSAFGRLIMHSGAMGTSRIFDPKFERELLPRGLHTSLLFKATGELRKGTSVTRQYREPARPIGQVEEYATDEDEDELDVAGRSSGATGQNGCSDVHSVASHRHIGTVEGGCGAMGHLVDHQRMGRPEYGEELSHTKRRSDSTFVGLDMRGSIGMSQTTLQPTGTMEVGKSNNDSRSSSLVYVGEGTEIEPLLSYDLLRRSTLSSCTSTGMHGRPPEVSACGPLAEASLSSVAKKRTSFREDESGAGTMPSDICSTFCQSTSQMAIRPDYRNHAKKSGGEDNNNNAGVRGRDADSNDKQCEGGAMREDRSHLGMTSVSTKSDGRDPHGVGGGERKRSSVTASVKSDCSGGIVQPSTGSPPAGARSEKAPSRGLVSKPRSQPGPSLLRKSSYTRKDGLSAADTKVTSVSSDSFVSDPSSTVTMGELPLPKSQNHTSSGHCGDFSDTDRVVGRTRSGNRHHPLQSNSPPRKKSANMPLKVRTNTADIVDIVRRSLGGNWQLMGGTDDHEHMKKVMETVGEDLKEREKEKDSDGPWHGGGKGGGLGERRGLMSDGQTSIGLATSYTNGRGGSDNIVKSEGSDSLV